MMINVTIKKTYRFFSVNAGLGVVQAFVIFLVGSVTLSVLYHMKKTWSQTTAHNAAINEMQERADKIFSIMGEDLMGPIIALSDCSLSETMKWFNPSAENNGQFLELHFASFQDVAAAKPKHSYFQVSSNHNLMNDQSIVVCNGSTIKESKVTGIHVKGEAKSHVVTVASGTRHIDWSAPIALARVKKVAYFLVEQGGSYALARQFDEEPRKAIVKGVQDLKRRYAVEGSVEPVDELAYSDVPTALTVSVELVPRLAAKKLKLAGIDGEQSFTFARTFPIPRVGSMPIKYSAAIDTSKSGGMSSVRFTTVN